MTRIKMAKAGDTPFQRLFHSAEIASKWGELSDCLSEDKLIPKEWKENIRRVLATGNGCQYCQAKGRPAKPGNMNENTAMAFAEVFLLQREKTGDSFFQVLKETFTDEEIAELIAFICFTTAQQYYGALLGLKP